MGEGPGLELPAVCSDAPVAAHSPFPPRLGCQPHTGKVKPLDGTLGKGKAQVRHRTGRGRAGREGKTLPAPQASLPQISREFLYSVSGETVAVGR